jgi:tetratricopeptide (TPR) repeat protein
VFRRKYSIKEEFNWNINQIDISLWTITSLFLIPLVVSIFFPAFVSKGTFSFTPYSLFTYQIILASTLAGRYSLIEKNGKRKLISFSSLVSFIIYLTIFGFVSSLIQIILLASNTLDFISEAILQSSNEIQYQFSKTNLDVESFKNGMEEVLILVVCNFGFLLFGIFKLNKKKENLIKEYRKVIKENENIKFQEESIDKNNLKTKKDSVTTNISFLENKFNEELEEFLRPYAQLSEGDSLSEEIIKKAENAIMYVSEMISLEPKINKFYFKRGKLYYALNEWGKALKDISYFLDLKNSKVVCSDLYPEVYMLKAHCNFQLSEYQECINDCLLAESEEENEQIISMKAESYFMLENYVSAIKYFSKLIKIDPNNNTYLYFRGKSYLKIENSKKAVKDLEKCLENNPKDLILIEDLIQSYRLINDFDGVLIYLNKLIRMDNANIEALLFKAAILSNSEEYENSNFIYSKIIKLDPSQDQAHEGKGWCFYNLGDFSKAIASFSDAINLNPNNDTAYSGRALSYFMNGNQENANLDFSEAIKLNPNNIDAKKYFKKDN